MGPELAPRGGDGAQDLSADVELHVLEEERLLGFLGGRRRLAVGDDAPRLDLGGRDHRLVAAGYHQLVAHRKAQLELVHAARAGDGENRLLARLLQDPQVRFRLRRRGDEARRARGEEAADVGHHQRGTHARDVELLDADLGLAAQLEAAGGQEEEHHREKDVTPA
jgi:hypothetical protein